MSKTQLTGSQILNNSVVRADINIATTGSALITKLVAGTNVTITSTGADIGTGDVTVNAAGTTSLLSVFGRTGVVVKVAGDYNFTDLAGLLPLSQMPAFTGDITSSAGSTLTTLPTVNSNIGTFNSFTVNAKGFITAATLTTTLITSPLSSTVLSSYPDASSYYGNATTANGWPINGTLTGSRFATAGTQRLQGILSSSQYIRSWDATNLVWRVWVLTVDSGDYTGKGVILAGTATNTYLGLLSGADGLALSASSAATTGLAYSAMSIANGGTGATTAAAGLTNLGLTPLNSPAFTGNPTAPNPPNGDISSAIVTTAFVQRATNAVSTITLPTSGNINGNTAQLLVPVLILVGAITAAVSLSFPSTGTWCVINNSTGAFPVTLKTFSGTGITIAQGTTRSIVGDGTNIQSANTDLSGLSIYPDGGTANEILYNNAGSVGGMALLENNQNYLLFLANTVDPNTPTTGATYYSKWNGARSHFTQKDTSGITVSYQAAMSTTPASYWASVGNSSQLIWPFVTSYGFNMLTVGTATAKSVGLDFVGQNRRVGFLSAATAGSFAGIYDNAPKYMMGNAMSVGSNALGYGGFFIAIRCIINDPVSVVGQTFIGVASVVPTTYSAFGAAIQPAIGLCCDITDTVYYMGTSSGSAGSSWALNQFSAANNIPCNDAVSNGQYILDVRIYSARSAAEAWYYVKADNTVTAPYSVVTSGRLYSQSVPMPPADSLLIPAVWRTNATNTGAVNIEIISIYFETNYQ